MSGVVVRMAIVKSMKKNKFSAVVFELQREKTGLIEKPLVRFSALESKEVCLEKMETYCSKNLYDVRQLVDRS